MARNTHWYLNAQARQNETRVADRETESFCPPQDLSMMCVLCVGDIKTFGHSVLYSYYA